MEGGLVTNDTNNSISELKTYRILVERSVVIGEAVEVNVEATSLDEAMNLVENQHDNDLLHFEEVEREIGNVCFSSM